jgi:hypothetical protein
MGPIVFPEMSVRNYRYTLRNGTGECSSQYSFVFCGKELLFNLMAGLVLKYARDNLNLIRQDKLNKRVTLTRANQCPQFLTCCVVQLALSSNSAVLFQSR